MQWDARLRELEDQLLHGQKVGEETKMKAEEMYLMEQKETSKQKSTCSHSVAWSTVLKSSYSPHYLNTQPAIKQNKLTPLTYC